MMGGGIGQSDAGRVIVVFERALRIALLLTDVDAVVVAFDLIRLHADRNSVVSERGVRLAYLPLPAVAGAIDRSQVFILQAAEINCAGAGSGTEFARMLAVFRDRERTSQCRLGRPLSRSANWRNASSR